MKLKLTFRYILMVILSTLLIFGLTFVVLTGFENTKTGKPLPGTFAANFSTEIIIDDQGDLILSEKGQAELNERDAWIQFLDEEGYVIEGYNEPSYVSDHYSPVDIAHMNLYLTNNQKEVYYTDKIDEGINYLIALPAENVKRVVFEFDKQTVSQFFQVMLILAVLVFIFMGYIFSRRIANPVSQVLEGIDELARGEYVKTFKENGIYKSVFKRLNQLSTRLKSSELEQQKTKEQRGKWISNISHDLKTPLSTIKGYSEILSEPNYKFSSEEIREYSRTIHEKSIYMESMIEELRLNEELMEKGIELNRETDNLTTFIRDVIIDILNHPKYSKRKILFESTDETIIYSFDKRLVKRSIENLIYNALIHNNESTVVMVNIVQTEIETIITIEDNGKGMSSEELEQLFNRYYRGSNTKNTKGTGLGMSIAKEVIEAHGGTLGIKSEVNKGTIIIISL